MTKPIPIPIPQVRIDPEHEHALSEGRDKPLVALTFLVAVLLGACVFAWDITALVQRATVRMVIGH